MTDQRDGIQASDFVLTRRDGWADLEVSPRAAYLLVQAFLDKIRGLTWRTENPRRFRLISSLSRMAASLDSNSCITGMSFQDLEAMCTVQFARQGPLGEAMSLHMASVPMNHCPNSTDPVFADSVAKGLETVMAC